MILRAKSNLNHVKIKTCDDGLLTIQMNKGGVANIENHPLIFDDNETSIIEN